MKICQLSTADLNNIAILHKLAFPMATLTVFGTEAVKRYYSYQLENSHEVNCSGAFIDNQLVGFCVAGVFRGAEIGFLKKNSFFLILHLLSHPWLIFNEAVRKRINYGIGSLCHFSRKRIVRRIAISSPTNKNFGIQSIAVHPKFQGLGIGKQLLENAELIASQKGFFSMRLTVHTDNYQAISFYEKMGWQKIIRKDIWDGYMEKDITSNGFN